MNSYWFIILNSFQNLYNSDSQFIKILKRVQDDVHSKVTRYNEPEHRLHINAIPLWDLPA